MANYDWGGPLFVYQGRDYGTDKSDRENFFGLLRHDFSPKPSYRAYQDAVAGVGDTGGTGGSGGTAPENLAAPTIGGPRCWDRP